MLLLVAIACLLLMSCVRGGLALCVHRRPERLSLDQTCGQCACVRCRGGVCVSRGALVSAWLQQKAKGTASPPNVNRATCDITSFLLHSSS